MWSKVFLISAHLEKCQVGSAKLSKASNDLIFHVLRVYNINDSFVSESS